jgi:LysR family transcriptional regulator, regulator for bpeEF and oprC
VHNRATLFSFDEQSEEWRVDKVRAMEVFVRIVEANSFTKAAETLNLPRASLTATLQALEAYLGTQLIQRTTRRLSLTPDGAEYFSHCNDILRAIDTAELSFRGGAARTPRGKLRLDLPSTLGRLMVVPRLSAFRALYPEVELALSLSERLVDITQEGIDCALRVGQLQDSALVARRLGTMRFVTCASPSYLQQHGRPATVADLRQHDCIIHLSGRTGRAFDWDFVVGNEVVKVETHGPVGVNDADANVSCAVQGLGMAQAASYQVRAHLASGALVDVLHEYPPTSMPISLVYPQGRLNSPKVKAFADWITELFAADPELHP